MFKLRVSIVIEPTENRGTTSYGQLSIYETVAVNLPGFAEVGAAIEAFHDLATELGS